MTRKLAITDARRVYPDNSPRTLASIAAACDLQAIVGFVGDWQGVTHASWGETAQKSRSIAFWARAHAHWLNASPEALDYLGQGCSVVVGMQRDGIMHCCTWSKTKADCAGMKGWSQKNIFDPASIVPFQTVFGWGKAGIPTPLTPFQLKTLSPVAIAKLPELEGRV